MEVIERKFTRYILEGKIIHPKQNKQDFFQKKAESSLLLAKELLKAENYLDWCINISYYSMFYNAVSLLAHANVDLDSIDDNIHSLTYQGLVYFYHLKEKKIEKQYLEDFKTSMEESDIRLKNLAKRKTEEILGSFKNAREQRAKNTYELGKIAELDSAKSAMRRAESFDILAAKLRLD